MAKNKIDAKEIGLTVLLGSGVVVLTPLIAGFLAGIGFMGFEIIPGLLTVGTAISSGVAAFVMNLGISQWLR